MVCGRHASHRLVSHRFASHKLASHRFASHRLASHRLASHRFASHRFASHRFASHRFASHRFASHRHTSLTGMHLSQARTRIVSPADKPSNCVPDTSSVPTLWKSCISVLPPLAPFRAGSMAGRLVSVP